MVNNQPKEYDAVLGNQARTPLNGVVLGGLQGIKRRLLTTDRKTQIAALCETLKYGEAGLDLVIRASTSTETQVQLAAERILIQQRNIPELKQKLLEYNPWLFCDCLLTLNEHSDRVTCVAVDASGLSLASGSNDKTIKIWSLPTSELQHTLEGHSAKVNSIVFTSSGELVSCGKDNTILTWDWQKQDLIAGLKDVHSQTVDTIAITPNNQMLISASWHIYIWKFPQGRLLHQLEEHGYISSVAISPDGKIFVSDCGNLIKVWELPQDNFINIWSQNPKLVYTLTGHTGKVTTMGISKDSKKLVSGSEDKTIKIWNLQTGHLIKTLEGHVGKINCLAISPDNQIIVSASNDKTVKIWDLKRGTLLRTLEGHSKVVRAVTISPDCKTIISGSWDNTIKVWGITEQ